MQQKNLVIFVFDENYGKRFLNAASSRKQKNVNYFLFHDINQLEKFSKEQEIDYLILDTKLPIEVRNQLEGKKKCLLVEELEERGSSVEEDAKTNTKINNNQEILIYKYQSIDKILKLVFREAPPNKSKDIEDAKMNHHTNHHNRVQKNGGDKLLREEKSRFHAKNKDLEQYKKEGKVIGIYSPIHRIGKTNFAIHLGREIAKSEAVLYLNFEPFASGTYFKKESVGNLENLLYSANQEYQNLGLTISAMAGQIEKLDYINPMPIMEDLFKVSGNEWKEIIARILEQSIYSTIILDLSDGIRDLFSILSFCDTVYTLYIDEPTSLGKLKRYTDNLIRTGYDCVLEHTIQKKVEWS